MNEGTRLAVLWAMTDTVLIVDDEASVRRGLRSLLESLGLEVTAVEGLTQAELALASQQFDLVMADLNLSRGRDDQAGFGVIDMVRARGHVTPVVVFTAHGSDDVRTEALRRGANDLWSKSLPIEELIQRVMSIIKRIGSG